MDSSLQSTHSVEDNQSMPLETRQEVGEQVEEMEHSIHLPNPSLWPLLLGLAIMVVFVGLLIVNTTPWVSLIGLPFVFVGIIGWSLEDPMAKRKEKFVSVYLPQDTWPFKLGQYVVDKEGVWLGKVQARFPHYLLVERGSILPKVYYVPYSAIKLTNTQKVIILSLSEDDLRKEGLDHVPDDLYDDLPEYGVPKTSGVAQFARKPLSPAETGHYNYGRNWPGMNTDASGSYPREEVVPRPQLFVSEVDQGHSQEVPLP